MTNRYQILKTNQLLPHPCYSMKETEEHLKSLTKENFNLKLRIYFLEMRSLVSCNTVNETDSKDYVELLMENYSLKNDLNETQDLIKQAAMAIDILERNQKVKNMENDDEKKIQLNTIQNQNKTISSLTILTNSLKNVRNTQINKNDIVTKMATEFNTLKSCNVNFSDQITNLKKHDISKELVLKNEVRNKFLNQLILIKSPSTGIFLSCYIIKKITYRTNAKVSHAAIHHFR